MSVVYSSFVREAPLHISGLLFVVREASLHVSDLLFICVPAYSSFTQENYAPEWLTSTAATLHTVEAHLVDGP